MHGEPPPNYYLLPSSFYCLQPKGFSLHVCLALLLANTLRIIFWFGRHFETPLLIQSVLMNIAMFALIHLCVSINNKVRLVFCVILFVLLWFS